MHARMLLLEEKMLVSEVAGTIGYKNANHFSTAFKRKFGITPKALR
jgi:AraC family transcriptional activator of pyochelin receptor